MAKVKKIKKNCPMEIGLNILSGKWKLQIIWRISKGKIRFNELQRELSGITTKVLTMQLRELERDGIIDRTIYPEVPPKVEYQLTELGKTIQPVLGALCNWGNEYIKERSLQDAR